MGVKIFLTPRKLRTLILKHKRRVEGWKVEDVYQTAAPYPREELETPLRAQLVGTAHGDRLKDTPNNMKRAIPSTPSTSLSSFPYATEVISCVTVHLCVQPGIAERLGAGPGSQALGLSLLLFPGTEPPRTQPVPATSCGCYSWIPNTLLVDMTKFFDTLSVLKTFLTLFNLQSFIFLFLFFL